MSIHLAGTGTITRRYAHVFLSPHLDDAALSCGGTIARLTGEGQPVLVVNVCAGSPPPAGPFSAFATELHTRWALPADEAVARRLAEDAAALAILGADSLGLGLLDAIYRMPAAYVDDATLFGTVAPGDTLAAAAGPQLAAIAAHLPGAVFYAPLGVGSHVDHQAVYAAAASLAAAGATVAFYEDYPYVAVEGALEHRLAELGGPAAFLPTVVGIDTTLPRKIAAVAAYTSQIDALFGGQTHMAAAVTAYARQVAPADAGYGERGWVRR